MNLERGFVATSASCMMTDDHTFQISRLQNSISSNMHVVKRSGTQQPLDLMSWYTILAWASRDYKEIIDIPSIIEEALKNIFNGIPTHEVSSALIMATTVFTERDPAYGNVAAQLMLARLFKDITGQSITHASKAPLYRHAFKESIIKGISAGILHESLATFDLDYLASTLVLERDNLFDYMGLKTLNERYFIKEDNKRFELPQLFWMRIAIGLARNEKDKNERAVEFYHTISSFHYVPSTPTLMHAGLVHSQLSSCYLNTIGDDLGHIFKCIGDNAQLSKWSGGIGTDWTNIRSTGSFIKSIKTDSQGVIPFLKIANDTTAAINRSGSRRSAACVYLETWHLDIEDFLDLRRNTGDERRRTHDINTANWVPDLFIKRVIADGDWTLFSPEETPELHHIYGKAFEDKYKEYEEKARTGGLKKHKIVSATKLWRKMLSRLFETGHPWLTFKDPCNIRSPQDHAGVIHSSNLCTEITLNTSADETAVCNLGSVNLSRHIIDGRINKEQIAATIKTAIRMLDNVIDINFYPTIEAQNSNMRHRPIGLGIMGFQDALYQLDIAMDDQRTLAIADNLMELVAYHAIFASSLLAQERGAYASYKGSKWDRNLFPQDTIALLEQERGMPVEVEKGGILDWTPVREQVKKYGMRNSNTMALAPTATISNIAGCFPSIEPIYKNMYVKANMSGEFTVVNKYLIHDLKKINVWNQNILNKIKYYDGNIQLIEEIPQRIKNKYKEAFEIDALWLIKLTAARGKWIDQSQSHNVFLKGTSGKILSDVYLAGWRAGMKTFYYLRSLGATQIEKSTLDAKEFGFTQKRTYDAPATLVQEQVSLEGVPETVAVTQTARTSCSIAEAEVCESCQ